MAESEILPFSVAARRFGRHPSMLRKTWLRAGLPIYPTASHDKPGTTVQGVDMRMLEMFLMLGGCPRRVSSASIGAEVRRRFKLDGGDQS